MSPKDLTGYWSVRLQTYSFDVCVKAKRDIGPILFASSSLSQKYQNMFMFYSDTTLTLDHKKSYFPQMPNELLIRPNIISLIALKLDKSQTYK